MRVGHFTGPEARAEYLRAYDDAVATLPRPRAADVGTPHGTVRVHTCTGPPDPAPLVLLPGTGTPGAGWSSVVAHLTGRRTVHLVDPLGGPGASRQEVPLRSMADIAGWLRAVVDGLGLTAFHLAGMSLGGRCAFELARRSPGGLCSLTLVDPVNTLDRVPFRVAALAVGASPRAPRPLRELFLRTLGSDAADPHDPVARVAALGPESYASAQPHPSLQADADLRSVRVPTLSLLGGRSTVLDAGRARDRAALLPRGTAEVWPDATHALPAEHPERTADRILAHATRAEPAAESGTNGEADHYPAAVRS